MALAYSVNYSVFLVNLVPSDNGVSLNMKNVRTSKGSLQHVCTSDIFSFKSYSWIATPRRNKICSCLSSLSALLEKGVRMKYLFNKFHFLCLLFFYIFLSFLFHLFKFKANETCWIGRMGI